MPAALFAFHLSLQGMEQTSYDVAAFVSAWAEVWQEVTCLPNFNRDMIGRVFVDVLNEPDSQGQGWQPKDGKPGQLWRLLHTQQAKVCNDLQQQVASHLAAPYLPASVRRIGLNQSMNLTAVSSCDARPTYLALTCDNVASNIEWDRPCLLLCCGVSGMTDLYVGVMDKLWGMTPTAPLFIVEGGGQGNYSGLNWGNGFITDKQIIKDYSISDANPFFQTLLVKPYLNRYID